MVRTFDHQGKLPRLPIPELNATLKKYLRSCRPVLTPTEYAETVKAVKEFGKEGGMGQILQQRLLQHEKALSNERGYLKGSWIEKWWLEMAYLAWREPLIIYSNWYLAYADRPMSRIQRAARLITHSLEFKEMIDKETFPVEKVRDTPLCMDQYRILFSTCRIPGEKTDYSKVVFNSPYKFIIAIHRDQFYQMQVLDDDGQILSIDDLESQLQEILNYCDEFKEPRIGLFTAQHRDIWGKVHKMMEKYPVNRTSFEIIENALFAVCLDECSPVGINALAQNVLYSSQGKNRWFDKALSFVVCANGRAGLSGEHSPFDGIAAGTFSEFILARELLPVLQRPRSQKTWPITKLRWEMDENLAHELYKAQIFVEDLTAKIDLQVFEFDDFGVDEIRKTIKISPDAVMQVALQLTYYRLHHSLALTYESASTRRFLHGRTEAVRALSVELAEFVQEMDNPLFNAKQRYQLLKKANEAHVAYLIDASAGSGVDRHLMGLYNMLQSEEQIPAIYQGVAYNKTRDWILSTSNMAPGEYIYPGYGPGVHHGYGVCYIPQPTFIRAGISSWKTFAETDSSKFSAALRKSLIDLHTLALQANQTSQSKL